MRAIFLAAGGIFMLWRAWGARRASREVSGAETLLGSRIALIWALVGVLALLAAGAAVLALRHRAPVKTLRLRDLPGGSDRPGGPHDGAPGAGPHQ